MPSADWCCVRLAVSPVVRCRRETRGRRGARSTGAPRRHGACASYTQRSSPPVGSGFAATAPRTLVVRGGRRLPSKARNDVPRGHSRDRIGRPRADSRKPRREPSPRRSTVTVSLVRKVDASTVPLLRVALEGVYASRPDLVILDLSEVTLFDPSALATLVATRRRLAGQQATLSIRRPSPIGARILRTSGLARVLDFG